MYETKLVLINESLGARAYICLHDIEANLYSVQQCEFILRDRTKEDIVRISLNTIELFLDDPKMERHNWFKTIKEAIDCFNQDFGFST